MTINSVASTQLNTAMQRIATGQRINSAADDAAGLAISERMTAQIRGLEQGTRNVMDMQSLVSTAEGGLSGITDSLHRIRELSLQAQNGILTDDDRQNIQFEINQLMQEINDTTQRTEFNSMRLLDGSFNAEDGRGLHVAADAQGRGPTVHIGNMSANVLMGPEPYDVTGEFDISRVDEALTRVTSERAYLGAMYNRFDTTIASNQITNLNLAAARSRVRDQDIAQAAMHLEQQNVIEQAQIQAQRIQMEQEQLPLASLLT